MKLKLNILLFSLLILILSYLIISNNNNNKILTLISTINITSNISPTSYYTNYIWYKNNISLNNINTIYGMLLYYILEPFMLLSKLLSGPTIENMLLSRHKLIDYKLNELINNNIYDNNNNNNKKKKKNIIQIIEIASGLSCRGLRFIKRYNNNNNNNDNGNNNEFNITYIESDFQDMVNLKYKLLENELKDDNVNNNYIIVPVNALLENGTESLSYVMNKYFDYNEGVIVITEGLLPYFSNSQMNQFWSILSNELKKFSYGVYLTDIHIQSDVEDFTSKLFIQLLSLFVKSSVNTHYKSINELNLTLQNYNINHFNLYKPNDYNEIINEINGKGPEKVMILEVITKKDEKY